VTVNSAHHQGVKDLAPSLRATGYADDGLIEVLEALDAPWLLAVQWHPEMNYAAYPDQRWPFRAFAQAVRAARGQRRSAPSRTGHAADRRCAVGHLDELARPW
jgi:putative glutamine amidotransferase